MSAALVDDDHEILHGLCSITPARRSTCGIEVHGVARFPAAMSGPSADFVENLGRFCALDETRERRWYPSRTKLPHDFTEGQLSDGPVLDHLRTDLRGVSRVGLVSGEHKSDLLLPTHATKSTGQHLLSVGVDNEVEHMKGFRLILDVAEDELVDPLDHGFAEGFLDHSAARRVFHGTLRSGGYWPVTVRTWACRVARSSGRVS